MDFRSSATHFPRFVDVRPGEARRIMVMAAFLFFLLAANNVIKVVRDSLFLSRFPITQLPYMYLLAALVAAVVIGIYSRYTTLLAFSQVILGSLAFIISNAVIFWLLVTFYGAGWVLYAYYMWSAVIGLTLVAQFWTLANEMFTPREGKRLFGIIAAGGTLGGMTGGIVANWGVRLVFGTNQLLWLVVAFLTGACGVAFWALRKQGSFATLKARQDVSTKETAVQDMRGVFGTVISSRYLQMIGGLIFVSVVVSTLIDYQFKAFAKDAYGSADALAGFFGAYYAWLSVITLLAQLWLTGKILTVLGLIPSLLLLPVTLMVGSLGLLAWPGLFTATANRMAEASLRISVSQSSVQILYLPISDSIKKKVKVFMDVTVERLGDGVAALIILFVSLVLGGSGVTLLGYFSVVFILIWIATVLNAHRGYIDSLRRSLAFREISLETVPIDFTDKATVEAVLTNCEDMDEQLVLFGLDFAEKFDQNFMVARLPRGLLRHPSFEVRRRALMLFAYSLDPKVLAEALELLASESPQLRSEAIKTVATILKKDAVPVIQPFLNSAEPEVRRSAIQCMLQNGDPQTRHAALAAFHNLLTDRSLDGEKYRIEAVRLMGEVNEPEFSGHLSRVVRDDPSPLVIREAMAAAATGAYHGVIRDIISHLGSKFTNVGAHEALVRFGEIAVGELKEALFDPGVSRDIRLNIPRSLSKIHAQSAMNVLLGGLLEEDRSLRFKVILALDDMARRFTDLKVSRERIESAIISDAMLYCRRLAVSSALFNPREEPSVHGRSLLYLALAESMERVLERVMWLLSIIYPAKDVRSSWSGLNSADPVRRAHAIELLDNLMSGQIKKSVFPLYSDSLPSQRLRMALDSLGMDSIDTDSALRVLLAQDDRWLKVATVWEIGIRKFPGFRDIILKLANSSDPVVSETANIVLQEI